MKMFSYSSSDFAHVSFAIVTVTVTQKGCEKKLLFFCKLNPNKLQGKSAHVLFAIYGIFKMVTA